MYESLKFYQGFLVDHYYYKTVTFKAIIDDYERLKSDVLVEVEDVNDKDYINTLRADLRATYFQAIETLFELIFALEPEDGRYKDKDIWLRLATANFRKNYARIGDIAEGDTEFLNRSVGSIRYGNGAERPVTLLEYVIFYTASDPEIEEHILASFPAIKRALVLFAKEFSNREEYNAIKHGLRIFPVLKQFGIGNRKTGEFLFKLDMEGSMTYIKEEGNKSISLYTAPLDTERDVRMTYLCSSLIHNIITIRRFAFSEDKSSSNLIYLPTLDEVKELSQPNVKWSKFSLNIKPIYATDVDEEKLDPTKRHNKP